MKAIRVHEFGGPEVMKLREVPDPRPARGEVVVRVEAAGVNPVDAYIRAGGYALKPHLPYTAGADGSGTVEALGEGVTKVAKGARVYVAATATTGTYAEWVACKLSEAHPLAETVTFAQGAAVGVPYATAYRALFQRAHARPSETVLVHGASGGVGVACLQLARAAGLTVIGTAGSERGRELVAKEGAHHVLDHGSPDFRDQLLDITAGRGVDVIVEMLANVNLGKDLTLLASCGRVVVVGSRGTVEVNPRDAMARDASILGMSLLNATEAELTAIHAAIGAGLENGALRPVVGREMALAEAPAAHQAIMEPGSYGKIVLVP